MLVSSCLTTPVTVTIIALIAVIMLQVVGLYAGTCSDKSIEIESGKVLYQVVTNEGKGKLET